MFAKRSAPGTMRQAVIVMGPVVLSAEAAATPCELIGTDVRIRLTGLIGVMVLRSAMEDVTS